MIEPLLGECCCALGERFCLRLFVEMVCQNREGEPVLDNGAATANVQSYARSATIKALADDRQVSGVRQLTVQGLIQKHLSVLVGPQLLRRPERLSPPSLQKRPRAGQ